MARAAIILFIRSERKKKKMMEIANSAMTMRDRWSLMMKMERYTTSKGTKSANKFSFFNVAVVIRRSIGRFVNSAIGHNMLTEFFFFIFIHWLAWCCCYFLSLDTIGEKRHLREKQIKLNKHPKRKKQNKTKETLWNIQAIDTPDHDPSIDRSNESQCLSNAERHAASKPF